jgi:histone deacetylase 1/2
MTANNLQYFAPDFELDVRPSNMENANSNDYLHKIKSAVIENIRRTGKPSVEAFQNIPENPLLSRMDSDVEDEDDDMDADENPDVRVTQRQRDQQIEHEGELYDLSDDEEYKQSLGVRAQPGTRRRRNIMDFQNPNPAEDGGTDALDNTRGLNGEIVRQRQSVSPASSARALNGTSSRTRTPANPADADDDGDVDMEESENPSGSAPTG